MPACDDIQLRHLLRKAFQLSHGGTNGDIVRARNKIHCAIRPVDYKHHVSNVFIGVVCIDNR